MYYLKITPSAIGLRHYSLSKRNLIFKVMYKSQYISRISLCYCKITPFPIVLLEPNKFKKQDSNFKVGRKL
jgi:hypothetical protein